MRDTKITAHLADLDWRTPPECRGQIVESAFAADGEDAYKRVHDHSDGEVTYYRGEADDPDTAWAEWAPQDHAPRGWEWSEEGR